MPVNDASGKDRKSDRQKHQARRVGLAEVSLVSQQLADFFFGQTRGQGKKW